MGAIFLDALPEGLSTARRALAEGDAATVGQVAHSLKSSAGQMGAVAVERLCLAMEPASRTGDLPALAALLSEAEREGAAYARWLDGELERSSGGGLTSQGSA
jgi:HPt (histidine-containing phosphotransfer) domain-containing protein